MILGAGLAKLEGVKVPIVVKVNGDLIPSITPKIPARSRHCRLPRNAQRDRLIIDQTLGVVTQNRFAIGVDDLPCPFISDQSR